MSTKRFRYPFHGARTLVACALLASIMVAPASADETLEQAKELYQAASYEEALAALAAIETPEALEYRGLCLIALGRLTDAERAVEALVTLAPGFTLTGDERPPRFVALFTTTRRRVLPGVVRKLFADAREQYRAKAFTRARDQFEQVLALANDPIVKDSPEMEDVRLLAAGFGDLVRAGAAGPAPDAKSADTPRAAAATPGAAPGAPPPPVPAPGPDVRRPTITQPSVIRQVFPGVPAVVAAMNRPLNGAVRIRIGTDGKVKSASIATSVHPQYDMQLLIAARSWLYTPATVNGVPTETERIVEVQLNTP